MIDIGLYIVYALFGIALIAAVAFPLMYSLKHPKEAKGSFIGVVLLIAIFGITYALSSSELSFAGMEKFNLTPSTIKFVGAGINTIIVLGVIGIVAAVVSEVTSAIK